MKMKFKLVMTVVVIVALVSVFINVISPKDITSEYGEQIDVGSAVDVHKSLPDFTQYSVVSEKKQAFFDFIYPIVHYENEKILRDRNRLQTLSSTRYSDLSDDDQIWIQSLVKKYRVRLDVNDPVFYKAMLARVDFIPPSLALTQAAIESGWGSSRFSKEANNLFGQWCFTRGCGVVPKKRESNKTHEVAKFPSVNAAVAAYLLNLNTNSSYSDLRSRRAQLRERNRQVTGVELAKTLLKYSEEGSLYVSKVTKFINQNNLFNFKQVGA